MSDIGKNKDGFTAVELLIMLVLLVVTFTAFANTFNTIQSVNKQAHDINVANQLAFAKIQQYENKPYTSLPATSPAGSLVQVENFTNSLPTSLPGPRSALVYVNTVSSTLKQVIVNVQYGGGGGSRQHTLEYADFIQKNGL